MIKFRPIHDLANPIDQKAFFEARVLFCEAFPHESEGIDRIERLLGKRARLDFDPLLLVAENRTGTVIGICFVFYFPELQFGYLQYIASDPKRAARGIGGALYEAMRELLVARSAQGLLFDVPPDTSKTVSDPKSLPINRKRISFYERYGARIIEGSDWDVFPNPRNDYYLTMLMFDPLDRTPRLRQTKARAVIRHILMAQSGYEENDPFVVRIARSFGDDPVRLRRARRAATAMPVVPGSRLRPISVVAARGHEIHHVKQRGYVERAIRRAVSTLARTTCSRSPAASPVWGCRR